MTAGQTGKQAMLIVLLLGVVVGGGASGAFGSSQPDPPPAAVKLPGERIWLPAGADTSTLTHPGFLQATGAPEVPGRDVLEVRTRRTTLRCGLLLLGAGSAALGVHYKGRADQAYDAYLHTGNLRKMRDAFGDAERYDHYALGCWVVAEVSLMGFLYLLMRTQEPERWSFRTTVEEADGHSGVQVEVRF